MSHLPYFVAAWLLAIGLYGVVTSRHLAHLVQCLAVLESSSYVLLAAIGYRRGAIAPYFGDRPPTTPTVDPVVHALMLTDVVVEAAVMALLLTVAVKAHESAGTASPDALAEVKG